MEEASSSASKPASKPASEPASESVSVVALEPYLKIRNPKLQNPAKFRGLLQRYLWMWEKLPPGVEREALGFKVENDWITLQYFKRLWRHAYTRNRKRVETLRERRFRLSMCLPTGRVVSFKVCPLDAVADLQKQAADAVRAPELARDPKYVVLFDGHPLLDRGGTLFDAGIRAGGHTLAFTTALPS